MNVCPRSRACHLSVLSRCAVARVGQLEVRGCYPLQALNPGGLESGDKFHNLPTFRGIILTCTLQFPRIPVGQSPGSLPSNQLPIYPFLAFPPAPKPSSSSLMPAFWHCFLITPHPQVLVSGFAGEPQTTNTSWQKVNLFPICTKAPYEPVTVLESWLPIYLGLTVMMESPSLEAKSEHPRSYSLTSARRMNVLDCP